MSREVLLVLVLVGVVAYVYQNPPMREPVIITQPPVVIQKPVVQKKKEKEAVKTMLKKEVHTWTDEDGVKHFSQYAVTSGNTESYELSTVAQPTKVDKMYDKDFKVSYNNTPKTAYKKSSSSSYSKCDKARDKYYNVKGERNTRNSLASVNRKREESYYKAYREACK